MAAWTSGGISSQQDLLSELICRFSSLVSENSYLSLRSSGGCEQSSGCSSSEVQRRMLSGLPKKNNQRMLSFWATSWNHPPFWQCQDFGSACHCKPSLTHFGLYHSSFGRSFLCKSMTILRFWSENTKANVERSSK